MLIFIFRTFLLTISGYLYYLFIFKDVNNISLLTKILLIVILLMAMIVTKSKSNQVFKEKSAIDIIDTMNQSTFVNYVSELYKHLGFTVNLPNKDEKNYCDIIVYNRKGKTCIKCYNHETDLSTVDFGTFRKKNDELKRTKFMVITNSFCDEDIKSSLQVKKIEVLEREFLLNSLNKLQEAEDRKKILLKFAK